MSDDRATTSGAEECFWERFVDRAGKSGANATAVRWHVRRAEAYLKAFPAKRLAQHTREDVNGYLEQAGRLDRITDWQFVQIVDAVENLLVTAQAPVAEEVDWGFWRDSAGTLAPEALIIVPTSAKLLHVSQPHGCNRVHDLCASASLREPFFFLAQRRRGAEGRSLLAKTTHQIPRQAPCSDFPLGFSGFGRNDDQGRTGSSDDCPRLDRDRRGSHPGLCRSRWTRAATRRGGVTCMRTACKRR